MEGGAPKISLIFWTRCQTLGCWKSTFARAVYRVEGQGSPLAEGQLAFSNGQSQEPWQKV